MKTKFLIFLSPLFFFLIGCDKIKTPIQSNGSQVDTTKYIRKVLLEDYTGHTCGNCPPAAVQAESLDKQYGGKVVVIAVHAGGFAKAKPAYPDSYTTTVGNDWDGASGFNISANGNPNGMVNRRAVDGSTIQSISKWPTSVSLALNEPYILGMTITPTYDASSRNLSTTVKAKFRAAYTNSTTITLVLTEDSIIGAQTDYTKDPDKIPNYVFMHMLRGDINGSFGTPLINPPIAAMDSVSVSFNNFAIKPEFKDKNLYLVAFTSDATTKEVLQVEKVKIKQ